MAQFKVRVIVKAQCEYEVFVEADSECKAEDLAISMDYKMLPDDFQVNKGYVTDWEIDELEQLSWECSDCGEQITEEVSRKNDELCDPCNERMKIEEEAAFTKRAALLATIARLKAEEKGKTL